MVFSYRSNSIASRAHIQALNKTVLVSPRDLHADNILIRTGDLNIEYRDKYEQEFEVDKIIMHEDYDCTCIYKLKKEFRPENIIHVEHFVVYSNGASTCTTCHVSIVII